MGSRPPALFATLPPRGLGVPGGGGAAGAAAAAGRLEGAAVGDVVGRDDRGSASLTDRASFCRSTMRARATCAPNPLSEISPLNEMNPASASCSSARFVTLAPNTLDG